MNEDEVEYVLRGRTSFPIINHLPKGITSDYADLVNECLSKDAACRPAAGDVSLRLRAIDASTRPDHGQRAELVHQGRRQ